MIAFFPLGFAELLSGIDGVFLTGKPFLAHGSRRAHPAPFLHQSPIAKDAGRDVQLIKPVQVLVGVMPFQVDGFHDWFRLLR